MLRPIYATSNPIVRVAISALAFLLSVSTIVEIRVVADEPRSAESQIQDHLNAGEFGPALALARRANDAASRNQLLCLISTAQVASGARVASLDTASYITDDQSRSRQLERIGSQPIGGARGGAPQADFDSLIELITSTIAPESWDEAGGPGAIDGFQGGVFVDSTGVLRRIEFAPGETSLTGLRKKSAHDSGNLNVRRAASLRKVSLVRLEKQLQMLRALGREPDESMRALAGLHKIKYVFVYPESGDIVLAGPAGDWRIDTEGRRMSLDASRPVLNLDDLIVVLRNAYERGGRFGCSITPRKKNLAQTKSFIANSKLKGEAWANQLRDTLGRQDISVYGIDPRTRAARVMVEADYRMKLVGMGLEDGTLGVSSYLDSSLAGAGGSAETDVIRWWFTLNYLALQATKDHNAFHLRGQGVKVLSENELLTDKGDRVHTGRTGGPTAEFAHSFTRQFPLLAAKYPIYAELQNLFDLALVAALIRAEDMPGQVGWNMTYFSRGADASAVAYRVELGAAPREVDSVMNHRVIRQRTDSGVRIRLVAGVSGGVTVRTASLVSGDSIQLDQYGQMDSERAGSAPKDLPRHAWWWD